MQSQWQSSAPKWVLLTCLLAGLGAALSLTTQAAGDPIIAAAGDIACDPASSSFNGGLGSSSSCRQKYTSDLMVGAGYAAVLPLGDNQYYCGSYDAFVRSYDLSWGRLKSISRPAVGNHEYLTSGGTGCDGSNAGAAGYFRYFGAAAGAPSQGYYSFDVGSWHLVALNSNCSSAGGCSETSPQGIWLKADLAAHPNYCVLAYWHIPLFSSGGRASTNMKSLWKILYDNDADLVLAGHDHTYERFAPQTQDGVRDDARGLRSFIVGSGGANHTSFVSTAPNSEVRNADTYGVLKLTLRSTGYDWQFVPEPGKTFTDSGSTACHGNPASIATPTATPTVNLTPQPPTATPTATATPAPVGNVVTVTVAADAEIRPDTPTTNYGTAAIVGVDNSPIKNMLLKFAVTGLAGKTVTGARLWLYNTDPSTVGGIFYRVADSSWDENTVTWNNAPAADATSFASLASVTAGNWYNLDFTSIITGEGVFSVRATSNSTNGADYSAKEGTPGLAPYLVISLTASVPVNTATPTATATATPLPPPPATATPTPTLNPAATATPTPTPTATLVPLPTDTPTPTPTATLVPPPTATPTPAPPTSVFTPVADAYVSSSRPNTNYGIRNSLRLDASPTLRGYLLFDVQGLAKPVTKATLRLFANSDSIVGYTAAGVTDTAWNELTITYGNAPLVGAALGASGVFSLSTWTNVDVTTYVTGNGKFSFATVTDSTTVIGLASRESGATAPQLVIETLP